MNYTVKVWVPENCLKNKKKSKINKNKNQMNKQQQQ